MFLAVRKLPPVVRLGGLPLLCLGVSILPIRADADPRLHAVTGTATPNKAADKSEQAPISLRFVSLDRVSGEDPQLPLALLQRYHGETVLATYQVCVRSDGVVLYVHRRSGIAEADPIIISTLRTWRYPPQPPNTLTCLHEVFEFSQ